MERQVPSMTNESQGPPSPQRRARAQKGTPEIHIKVSWCKGCGLCVDYCKTDVLVMDGVIPKVVQAERCNRCLQCEAICPDFAIEVGDAAPAGSAGKAETGRTAAGHEGAAGGGVLGGEGA
jgi:2-oxoglutarate ferredoxin oxidoreductase subunit delta